ncbi:MAG: DUF3124 domain-containing protein [Humidesulfovibrio sp.]|uniref:DUF3124 domain-containing protein n=1 Tax=Humidesulfovibrio sp. TaxID=2910988 RepID=UPI0027E5E9C5|nr:DUF3124 domain-containing protein [Humidesulfovibrio sp.]MDQ7835430.1 DUF3124 domain-containing protein [Humidesulfovibrio sp.]
MIRRRSIAVIVAALLVCVFATVGLAEVSTGQTQYVPCSSHIFHGPKTRPLDLTVTLVVRNIDTKRPLTLSFVDYYGSDGKLLRRYLAAPVVIPPLSAREFLVDEKDKEGGVGASFLVRWRSDVQVNVPIVEAVMIGSGNGLGISYINRGVAIQE